MPNLKFDSTTTKAAFTITLHGFGEECGSVDEPQGWNALVDVSSVILRNLGETTLADALDTTMLESGALAWIRADSDGRVSLVMYGHDEGPRSGTDAVSREWDKFTESHGEDDEG